MPTLCRLWRQDVFSPESLAERVEIGEPNTESFFGYYDLWPENSQGLLLCHQAITPQKGP